MQFGLVWIGFEKLIRNPIRTDRFSQNNIQTHPISFGFLWFSVFWIGFRFFIWIGLDLNTPTTNHLLHPNIQLQ